MNVVIVDGDISYPPTSGKRLRTFHLMMRMAQRQHRITYVCRGAASSEDARQAVRYLSQHDIEPIVVDDPVPCKRGWKFYARLALNLASPLPYAVASHRSPKLWRTVQELANTRRVDLWQFEWTPYAEALPWSRRIRKLINAHNVDSLLWQRYYETEAHPARRWYIKQQWRKFEKYERRTFPRVDRIVAVSPDDAALVRDRFGMERVDVVDNGIDASAFAGLHSRREPNHVLFLGSLEWRPNLDAVALLLDSLWPAVRAAVPDARLSIVGRNPPAWLRERSQPERGVAVHANVPDIRPFLEQCTVMAVPLRSGGGSRLKILEALAAGLPVVSTRIGAEGLSVRPGHDLTVVDDVLDMSAALVDCLRTPARAQDMAERGRQFVLKNYDWDLLASKLEQAWEKCL